MPYIDVQNVSFYYDNNPVLEEVSYSVNWEFVTLTGENGAAKSTLIKITLGILKPKSGKVIIARHDTQNRRLRIAYVPQQISSFNAGFPQLFMNLFVLDVTPVKVGSASLMHMTKNT